jgi:hypothetical protein
MLSVSFTAETMLFTETQLLQFSSAEHYTSMLVANMFWTDDVHAVSMSSPLSSIPLSPRFLTPQMSRLESVSMGRYGTCKSNIVHYHVPVSSKLQSFNKPLQIRLVLNICLQWSYDISKGVFIALAESKTPHMLTDVFMKLRWVWFYVLDTEILVERCCIWL